MFLNKKSIVQYNVQKLIKKNLYLQSVIEDSLFNQIGVNLIHRAGEKRVNVSCIIRSKRTRK